MDWGAAAAYRLSEAWSLGLGLSYHESELALDSSLWAVEDPAREESLFGPNPFLPETRLATGFIDSQDSDWSLTLGVLGQLSRRWSGAAFYRQGPDFTTEITLVIDRCTQATYFRVHTDLGIRTVNNVGTRSKHPFFGESGCWLFTSNCITGYV